MLMLRSICYESMSVIYTFVMHVSVYMVLCIHFHGYGYACMAGQTCIMVVIM